MNCVAISISKIIAVFITPTQINFDDGLGLSCLIKFTFLFKSKLPFLQYFSELGIYIHWPVSAKKVNFKSPLKALSSEEKQAAVKISLVKLSDTFTFYLMKDNHSSSSPNINKREIRSIDCEN